MQATSLHARPGEQHDFDVAIVGCGPAGAALANLLGRQGASVLVIERNPGIPAIPRAVHIDGETMRVFQAMGLGANMLGIMRPGGGMHWVDAAGDTLLVRTGLVGLGNQGWHNDYYHHQPQMEAVLRDGFRRYPNVVLRERTELKELHQDEGGVTLATWDHVRAQAGTIHCRYVVGCDGARSTVRQWVGERFEDLGDHQAWLVVDGVLDHPLDLPEYTVQHCDPARPSTSIYVHPLRRRWELMLLPGEDPRALIEPETVWKLLERWVKPSQATLERATTYVFHSLIAERWQNGRIFLAGDAVHQTPPFLGQGLCAGMRDVANLAWKLGAALRHPETAEALLATYGPERTPHAREFVALAVEVGRVIQVTDVEEAALRNVRLQAQGLKFAFPTPQLGPGIHRPGGGVRGRVFLQPQLPDGRWLDDCVGQQFAVLMTAEAALQADSTLRNRVAALGIVLIEDGGPRVQSWLEQQQAIAVVVRPDRYVYDVCDNLQALDTALSDLARWLTG